MVIRYVGKNVLYLLWALPWMFAGLVCVCTIVGIPIGIALWKIGVMPFERQAKRHGQAAHDAVYNGLAEHRRQWPSLTQQDFQRAIRDTPPVNWIDPNRPSIQSIDWDSIGVEDQEL